MCLDVLILVLIHASGQSSSGATVAVPAVVVDCLAAAAAAAADAAAAAAVLLLLLMLTLILSLLPLSDGLACTEKPIRNLREKGFRPIRYQRSDHQILSAFKKYDKKGQHFYNSWQGR